MNYFAQITNNIREVREELSSFILNQNSKVESNISSHINKIFSTIPTLKTIDIILQEVYHMKNEDSDTSNNKKSYQYLKWKDFLEEVDTNISSLKVMLQTYQNKQLLDKLEEIKQG